MLRLGRVASRWLGPLLVSIIFVGAAWVAPPTFAQPHVDEEPSLKQTAPDASLTCVPAYLRAGYVASATDTCVERLGVFPLEDVRPGMQGVGLTVVSGSEIEAFDVQILGVLEAAGPVGPLVLVRVSGGVIDRSGGIAAGMSGSPVYVDGKLLGAVGYGFEMTDHRVGLVTPAASMMALLDEVRGEKAVESVPRPLGGSERGPFERPPGSNAPEPISARVRPIRTPVMVSGLGERSLQYLTRSLAGYDVTPLPSGRSRRSQDSAGRPLEPGDAVGAQLVRGDIDVTAVGTVTAVDAAGNFIAFGHPFLRKGAVDFIATRAEVLQSIPSLAFPFKLAAPTAVVGRIARDRGAGISGEQGAAARTVALSVRTTDVDRRSIHEFSAEVVWDDSLLLSLLTAAALEGLDRGIDRIGAGTSQIELSIHTADSARAVHRTNMFYSSSDVSALSLADFASALRMLQSNAFVDPHLQRVEMVARIEEARKTAQIERAEPSRVEVAVGESVDVEVTLRPYRSQPIHQVVQLQIPPHVGTGRVTVTVRGGEYAFHSLPPEPGDPLFGGDYTEEFEPETPDGVESLENLVDEFEQQPRNNDLILEYYPPFRDDETSDDVREDEAEPAFAFGDPLESVEPLRVTHSTEYVLRGEKSFTLTLTEPL